MSELCSFEKKFRDMIRMKGYSKQTENSYWWHLENFKKFKKNIHETRLSSQDINDYLIYLNDKSVSESYFNQAINGIRFFFKYVLNKKIKDYLVVRPKKSKTQPIILSDEEIQKTFDVCDNIKHKSILSLMYGSGLRVSEVVNIKIKDVDSKNMVIWIRQSKGKKDRMCILSESTLGLLRQYYKEYRPKEWLFNGQLLKTDPPGIIKPYTVKSIQQFVKKISLKAGITKRVHPHLYRHGYCTGILDNGGDIHDVAVTAGHSSLKTSMGYIHSSPKYISQIKSPLSKIKI
jgi:site-specific recombinase XerD